MHDDLKSAAEILKAGGTILFPTDISWAIGCDATNAEAVNKLRNLCQKEDTCDLTILMENPALLERYIDEVPEIAWDLIEVSTTPLTVIYPGSKNFAANLPGADGSVSIRFVREDFTSRLLQRFRKPVVSAPAIISSTTSPLSFDDVPEAIKNGVGYIVEYHQESVFPAIQSSLIRLWPGGRIEILRK